jgi:hypothetical protein
MRERVERRYTGCSAVESGFLRCLLPARREEGNARLVMGNFSGG